MKNKLIRKQAIQIYKQNIAPMLLVASIGLVPTVLSVMFDGTRTLSWLYCAKFGFWIVTYPLLLGQASYFLSSVKGEKTPVWGIFKYYLNFKLLSKALLVSVVFRIVVLIFDSINKLLPIVLKDHPIGLIISLVVAIVSFYVVTLRFFLVPYIFIRNTGKNPLFIFSMGHRKMRGYVINLLLLMISVEWIPYLITFLFAALMYFCGVITRPLESHLWLKMLNTLFIIPFAPYISLCNAGFAVEMLRAKQKLRLNRAHYVGRKYHYKVEWEEFENEEFFDN